MNDLRIVFFGTPQFAATILKKLVENDKNIVAVVTAPDKPAGRGRKLNQSAVKEYALSQNLPVLQPTNLKSEEFLNELKSFEANLQIVIAFRMLPKAVWQMPELGTFNLHASLLPQYRGAAPINWVLINGETKTGVTTFFIDDKIDTGALIMQEEIEIVKEDNAGTLHDKLMHLGGNLVLKTVASIEKGKLETKPQTVSSDLKTAYKLDSDNTKINWDAPLPDIYNKIRGLSPYPAAWSNLINGIEESTIKIYSAKAEKATHTEEPGTVLASKKELKVAVNSGYIIIKELQLPGKKKMDSVSLLNGYIFEKNAKLL